MHWRGDCLLRQGTAVRSCRARAERGNFLLGIVTLLTSGTERAIVGVLPSSLPQRHVIAIFATCAGSTYRHAPMTAKFLPRQSPRLPGSYASAVYMAMAK